MLTFAHDWRCRRERPLCSWMVKNLHFLKYLPLSSVLIGLCLQSSNDSPYLFSLLERCKPDSHGPRCRLIWSFFLGFGVSVFADFSNTGVFLLRRELHSSPLSRNRHGLHIGVSSDHPQSIYPDQNDLPHIPWPCWAMQFQSELTGWEVGIWDRWMHFHIVWNWCQAREQEFLDSVILRPGCIGCWCVKKGKRWGWTERGRSQRGSTRMSVPHTTTPHPAQSF